jgi:hypothetical protein
MLCLRCRPHLVDGRYVMNKKPIGRPRRKGNAAAANDIRTNLPLGPRGRRTRVRPLQRTGSRSYSTGIAERPANPWVDEGDPEING